MGQQCIDACAGMTLPRAATALLNDQTSVGLLLYAVSTIFAAGMNTCAKLLSEPVSTRDIMLLTCVSWDSHLQHPHACVLSSSCC